MHSRKYLEVLRRLYGEKKKHERKRNTKRNRKTKALSNPTELRLWFQFSLRTLDFCNLLGDGCINKLFICVRDNLTEFAEKAEK